VKAAVEPEAHAIDAVRDADASPALRVAHPAVPAQASLPDHPLHFMQRALGNRVTRRTLTAGFLQPKLTVGAPDDIYEKEADEVAEQVMARTRLVAAGASGADDDPNNRHNLAGEAARQRSAQRSMLRRIPIRTLQQNLGNRALARLLQQTFPAPAVPELRRKCACGGDSKEECAECRKNRLALQRSSSVSEDADLEAPPIVDQVLATPGQPLADSARRTLEPSFGHDFSGVRVHDDSRAAESASAVNALAYTVGNHVVFGAGQYSPGTTDGNRLLAHELTHTIQQTGGTPTGIQRLSWDDVTGAVSEVGQAVEQGAQAVESAVSSGAQAVGSAVGSGVQSAVQAGEQALEWLATEAGKLALSSANALAGMFGGSVTVGPTGLIIEIPEIELLDSLTVPIIPSAGSVYLPILEAGFAVPPVAVVGSVGVRLTAPSLTAYLGPGKIRDIRVIIDPASSKYSATGQVYLGAALSEKLDVAPAVRGDVVVVIPSDPPIPVDGALEGGLRLTIRGSALGSLADKVTLAYASGKLSLDQNFTLQLGPLLEADTDLYIDVLLEGMKICEWAWPQDHWEMSKAEQYDLPIHIGWGGGGPPVTIGPVTSKPIPITDIETRLGRSRPKASGCMTLEDIWRELCKKGKLPPAICPSTTPGGGGGGGGGGTTPGGGKGGATTSGPCGGSKEPDATWGDFHHYSKNRLAGTIKKGQDWADYDTNSQAEARAATGVPDSLCFQATLKEGDAAPYLPRDKWTDRRFFSIVFGKVVSARHFEATADVPGDKYFVSVLDAKK
jgi:hypothetical protein